MEHEKKEVGRHINLVVKHVDSSEVQFKVKDTIKFQKIFDAYCAKKGIDDQQAVRFRFDGHRLEKEKTPKEVEMEDGDIIDVFVEQLGGGRFS
mmetsp:Transcript_29833/g.47976  ORF Transcript_29833/g.47976 Transcript_29833/m.47976 type:complete len:93 (+) Transcript_29833:2-280(+)